MQVHVCLAFASRIGARQTRGRRVGPREVGVQVPWTCTSTYTKASRLPRADQHDDLAFASRRCARQTRGKREANVHLHEVLAFASRLPRADLDRPDVALSGVQVDRPDVAFGSTLWSSARSSHAANCIHSSAARTADTDIQE